jgi:hypothetical protein
MDILASRGVTNIVRTRPSLVATMGEVGGTCEIVVIGIGFIYGLIYWRRNMVKENESIWSLSEEEKHKYKAVTSHEIVDEEISAKRE